jgi:hypothetical protein
MVTPYQNRLLGVSGTATASIEVSLSVDPEMGEVQKSNFGWALTFCLDVDFLGGVIRKCGGSIGPPPVSVNTNFGDSL